MLHYYKFSPSSGSSLFRSPKVRRKEQVCAGRRAERKERLSLQVIYPLTCPEVLRAYLHPPHAPWVATNLHQSAPTCTQPAPARCTHCNGPSARWWSVGRVSRPRLVVLGGIALATRPPNRATDPPPAVQLGPAPVPVDAPFSLLAGMVFHGADLGPHVRRRRCQRRRTYL